MTRTFAGHLLATLLLTSILAPVAFANREAVAMGPPPGGCYLNHSMVEYAATIKSFNISNGEQTFDVMANPGIVIPVTRDGFHVDFVLHTDEYGFTLANHTRVYENSSSVEGLIWYGDTFNGYSQNRCLGPAQGGEDFAQSRDVPISQMYPDDSPFSLTAITSIDSDRPMAQFSVQIVDELPSEEQPPEPEQQPPTANNTITAEQIEEIKNSDHEYLPDEDDSPPSRVYSPFIFEPPTTEAGSGGDAPEVEGQAQEEQGPNNTLAINGRISSLYLADETADAPLPYILSGNWSMTVSNYGVTGFGADFTMAQIGSMDRHTHSLANFKSADLSGIHLNNDTIMLASAVDVQTGNKTVAARVNVTIAIEKFNVIKLDLEDGRAGHLKQPIYGIVSSLVHNGKVLANNRGATAGNI